MFKIIKYTLADVMRNKIIIFYTILLLAVTVSILSLDDTITKALLSITSIAITIVPLVSLLFVAIYLYNSAEFIELLVSMPIQRSSIWMGIMIGVTAALMLALLIGIGLPLLLLSATIEALSLLLLTVAITLVFTGIAAYIVVLVKDKAKGIGTAILLWIFYTILYDALLLFIVFAFADYPIEKVMLFLTVFNPLDLMRIIMLIQLDVSAMMGYTGAIFRTTLGNVSGTITALMVMVVWMIVPLWLANRKFNKNDL